MPITLICARRGLRCHASRWHSKRRLPGGDGDRAGRTSWQRPRRTADDRRVSHAEREQVIGTVKAAFVHGMLAKDEFDLRVSQAFASRTYAVLAAVTPRRAG